MRISDWSSDVCSSDLVGDGDHLGCVRCRRAARVTDHLEDRLQGTGTHVLPRLGPGHLSRVPLAPPRVELLGVEALPPPVCAFAQPRIAGDGGRAEGAGGGGGSLRAPTSGVTGKSVSAPGKSVGRRLFTKTNTQTEQ